MTVRVQTEDFDAGFELNQLRHVRCVRNGAKLDVVSSDTYPGVSAVNVAEQNVAVNSSVQQIPLTETSSKGQPPQEAIDACKDKVEGLPCSFNPAQGQISGTCKKINTVLACVP